jgi:hypothetical protein
MIDIRVSEQTIAEAKSLVDKTDYGNGQFDAGNKEQQLVGIIGQIALCKILGMKQTEGVKYDGGYDVVINGVKVDIKTMGRTTYPRPYYVNNFFARQLDLPAEAFIFCSYNKTDHILTVCGCITKDNLRKISTQFPVGSLRTRSDGTTFKVKSNLCEVENKDLTQIMSKQELINSFK